MTEPPAAPARPAGVLVALASGLAAALLDLLPLPAPSGAGAAPLLTLGAVCFWSLHAPALLPPLAVFALGLALDAAAGTPPGLTALALLAARGGLAASRRLLLAQPFAVVWAGVALAVAGFAALRWLLASLWWGRVFPLEPSLAEAFLTAAFYPPVAWLLARLRRLAGDRRRAAGH